MKRIILLLLLPVIIFSCKNKDVKTATIKQEDKPAAHPAWIMQGNIYEVNIRQYTPEGTFKAFEKHLDRLKQMGLQTLGSCRSIQSVKPIARA